MISQRVRPEKVGDLEGVSPRVPLPSRASPFVKSPLVKADPVKCCLPNRTQIQTHNTRNSTEQAFLSHDFFATIHTQLKPTKPTVSMKLFEKMKNALKELIFGETVRCTVKRKTLVKLSTSSTSSALTRAFLHIPAFPWMGVPRRNPSMKGMPSPGLLSGLPRLFLLTPRQRSPPNPTTFIPVSNPLFGKLLWFVTPTLYFVTLCTYSISYHKHRRTMDR